MIQAGTPWLEQLSDIIRMTADWIAKFGELDPAIQKAVVVIAALAAAVGPVLIYTGLLVSSIGTLVTAFGTLTAFIAANPIVALAGLAAALAAFLIAWENDWGGIQDKTRTAVEFIQAKFNEMVAYITDRLPAWMAKLAEWGQAAWQWIADAAPTTLAKLGEWTMAAIGWIAGKLPDWIATLLNWATALVSWIADSLPAAIAAFGQWVQSFVGWGNSEGKSQLVKMIDGFIRVMSDWVVNDVIPKVVPALGNLGREIVRALGAIALGIGEAAINIGIGIVQGMISGINSMWQRLYEAARHAASGALDSAKAALGISSPSKEGIKVGANFGESIGMGVRSALGNIDLDVTAGLRGVVADIEPRYSAVGAGARMAPAITLNMTFTGNVDRAAVRSGAEQGTLSALRQVGLA